MHSITKENLSYIQTKYLKEGCNFLYGAGLTGRRFKEMLTGLGVRIDYFVDDSPAKVNTYVYGCQVLSFSDMAKRAERQRINIIIATIYGNTVLGKLKDLSVQVFEAFKLYQDKYAESLKQTLMLTMSKAEWSFKMRAVQDICVDDGSKNVLKMYQEAVSNNNFDFTKIGAVASHEDHYFVLQMRETMYRMRRPLRIIDCGAYVGDMLWQLEKWQVPFEKLYAYEASPDIYLQLQENVKKYGVEDKTVLFPFACWDKETILSFDSKPGEDTAGAVVQRGGGKGAS